MQFTHTNNILKLIDFSLVRCVCVCMCLYEYDVFILTAKFMESYGCRSYLYVIIRLVHFGMYGYTLVCVRCGICEKQLLFEVKIPVR